MIIAVDARSAFSRNPRGTGKTLIWTYQKLAALKPDWRFIMIFQEEGEQANPFAGLDNVELVPMDCPGDRWRVWERWALPRHVRRIEADVLHGPANSIPSGFSPAVVTLHDLIPMIPEFCTSRSGPWAKRVTQAAMSAARVITPSEYSRQRIIKTFELDPETVRVVPWAPQPGCHSQSDPAARAAIRQKQLGVDRPIILAFGGRDERKNMPRIVSAYASLPKTLREQTALVMIGVRQPMLGELTALADQRGAADDVRLKEYVPEDALLDLMAASEIVCYPTLAEGFGLPVLDAFASGAAVIAGNVTAVPEVAGQAACLINPRDERSIAAALEKLLNDPPARATLIERGLARATMFSWEQTALLTADVLQEAAE